MIAPVFVDTNVFVYWRDSTDTSKQVRATEWLTTLWRENRGRTRTQVLAEYYTVVSRKPGMRMPREAAWRDVQALRSWKPQPVDVELLDRAHAIELKHRLSWWDCQVVAAAQMQGCHLLLTEDLQDGATYDGVVTRSPFTMKVAEEAGAYTLPPRYPSRHRGRGRPRRNVGRGMSSDG